MTKTHIETDTDSYVDFIELDEEGVAELVKNALEDVGLSWEELQKQARAGRFSSAAASTTWFVVSSFMED